MIATRNGVRVLVVNLPEGGWVRGSFYEPGIHEAYMTLLREAAGELPLVDLREMLPDEGFYDFMHPTREAGLQISQRVATEIRKLQQQ